MATTRRQFPREFKLEAVRLAKESGKPPAQIAREIITHGAHEHDAEAQAYNAAFELPNSDMRGLPQSEPQEHIDIGEGTNVDPRHAGDGPAGAACTTCRRMGTPTLVLACAVLPVRRRVKDQHAASPAPGTAKRT